MLLVDDYLTGVVFWAYMQVTKRSWMAAGIGFVVAVLAFLAWSHRAQAPVVTPPGSALDLNLASSTESASTPTTVTVEPVTQPVVRPFPINPADTIASWSFAGTDTGNATLTAQANADIAKLTGLIGKGQYDEYDLYNGIANDYGALGNGKEAYQYYNRSIAIHPNKGLAYSNLGHLMDGLGAYHTAADAYAKAVAVEPTVAEYRVDQLTFLTRQFPKDTALVTAAFAGATARLGQNASIYSLEAQWLTGQGRYADAVTAWKTVKTLSPGSDSTAIDAEIARLQAKL
ncbi:MAG TPA: hypothetical protein PLW99_01215 [Candidatus Paceibacterota bacterium]|nr:hypothetical protein [Candidatus Paceibacterota bacterium]